MEQNINIAALLKDCPKGTRLYSPICGECELEKVYYCSINVRAIGNECVYAFQETGKTTLCGECLLFPSERMRHWEVFQARYVKGGNEAKEILEANGAVLDHDECWYENTNEVYYINRINNKAEQALLSEKEYLIVNGTELKLKEEQPKFKVGDAVKWDNYLNIIVEINGRCAIIDKEPTSMRGSVNMETLTLATPEEIAEWNKETLEPNHLHYSKSKRKIIHWFLPFDKCLMRDKDEKWIATLFSHFSISETDGNAYVNIAQGYYDECLPYNENTARLIGTTDNYEEE